jgi:hypothetical protein
MKWIDRWMKNTRIKLFFQSQKGIFNVTIILSMCSLCCLNIKNFLFHTRFIVFSRKREEKFLLWSILLLLVPCFISFTLLRHKQEEKWRVNEWMNEEVNELEFWGWLVIVREAQLFKRIVDSSHWGLNK